MKEPQKTPLPQQLLPQMTDVWQQTTNWQPTATQLHQFQRLYELILTGNARLNLTRITSPIEFWEKHLWDSLRGIAPLLRDEAPTAQDGPLQIIDIGTGAGFPGLPVAIALGHSSLTLLDSTSKKIAFLQTLLAQMGIEHVTTVIGRAEAIGKQPRYRAAYDVALLRAVATATVCLEYALPFLKVGGLAILYRGHWTPAEAEAIAHATESLGCCIESTEAFTTPISNATRHCLYVRKCD